MGSQTSKKNNVTDSMTEDDSESYKLVNIHTPTADLGFYIVVVVVIAMGLYTFYRYFFQAKWFKPGGGGGKERRRSFPPSTVSKDMTGCNGQVMHKQMAVYGGGDAKIAY